jgi:hypothetical protein
VKARLYQFIVIQFQVQILDTYGHTSVGGFSLSIKMFQLTRFHSRSTSPCWIAFGDSILLVPNSQDYLPNALPIGAGSSELRVGLHSSECSNNKGPPRRCVRPCQPRIHRRDDPKIVCKRLAVSGLSGQCLGNRFPTDRRSRKCGIQIKQSMF